MFKDIGFIQEGVKREAIWYMGGWRDIHQLAILEHEWRREPRDSVTSEELAVVLGSA
jgi:hypothetical protein